MMTLMKAPAMKSFRQLALATVALIAPAFGAAHAANGSWTPIYSDPTNGIFVSAISTTVSLSTPPLPTHFPGSRLVGTISTVSGTNNIFSLWGTVAGPIGVSASVSGVSATIIPSSTLSFTGGGSLTTITTNNSLHDVGYNISASAAGVVVRVIEIKQ